MKGLIEKITVMNLGIYSSVFLLSWWLIKMLNIYTALLTTYANSSTFKNLSIIMKPSKMIFFSCSPKVFLDVARDEIKAIAP